MSRKKIPRDRLIAELKRLGDELEKRPSAANMNQYGEYSHTPYIKEWGSWSNALEAADYEVDRTTITRSYLLDEYLRVRDKLGRGPTVRELDEHTSHSPATFLDRFDTVENMKNLALAYRAGLYDPEEEDDS